MDDATARKEFQNLLSSFSSQNQRSRISPREWKLLSPWIMDDIRRGESTRCIEEELRLLEGCASITQLTEMMTSKEGVRMIRNSIFHTESALRLLFVSVLGRIVLRVYIALNNEEVDLEGIIQVESSREAVRVREDFNDVAMEVIKSASLGSIGKAVGVDPATKNEVAFEDDARANEAYCDVLASLLECYFDSFSELDGWCYALLGLPAGSVRSNSIVNCSAEKAYSRSVCLLPLVKLAFSTAFADPYLLVRRATTQFFTEWNSNVRLVSNFLKCVLAEISSTGTSLTTLQLVDRDRPGRLFAEQSLSEDALTEDSRSGYNPLVIVELAQEWVCQYLMYVVSQSIDWEELIVTVKDVIVITQHRSMTYCRQQVCKAILQKLLSFLEATSGGSVAADRLEILCWVVLLLRDVWPSSSVSGPRNTADEASSIESALAAVSLLFIRALNALLLTLVVEVVVSTDDDVAMTRLLADFALTLVLVSMDSLPQARRIQEQKQEGSEKRLHSLLLTPIHSVLSDPIVQSRTLSKEQHLPGSRFIAALCYACSSAADATLTCLSRLVELASSLQPQQSATAADDSMLDLLSTDPLPVVVVSRFDSLDLLTSAATDTSLVELSSSMEKAKSQNSLLSSLSLLSLRNYTSAVRNAVDNATKECSPWSIFHERSFYRRHNIYYLLLSERDHHPSTPSDSYSKIVQSITRNVAEKEVKKFAEYLTFVQDISLETMKTVSCCVTWAAVGKVGDVPQVALTDLAMALWRTFHPVPDSPAGEAGTGNKQAAFTLMGSDLWRVLQHSGVTDTSILRDRTKAAFAEYSSLLVDTASNIAASTATTFTSRSTAQFKILGFFAYSAPLLACAKDNAAVITGTMEKLLLLVQSNLTSRWRGSESAMAGLLESLPTNGTIGGFGLETLKELDSGATTTTTNTNTTVGASIDIMCFNLLRCLSQAFAMVSRDGLQTVTYTTRCAAVVRDVEEVFMHQRVPLSSTPLASLIHLHITQAIEGFKSTYQHTLTEHSGATLTFPAFPAIKYDIPESITAIRKSHESCEKSSRFNNLLISDLHLLGTRTSSRKEIQFSKSRARPFHLLTDFYGDSFDCTDFSIVSSVLAMSESSRWKGSMYASSEDVTAIILDVVSPRIGLGLSAGDHTCHRMPLRSLEVSEEEKRQQEESLMDDALTYLSPRDRYWRQVSGSSDLITVLMSTEVNPSTCKVVVHVKAYNSSGFKIPSFRMELVTSSSNGTACFEQDGTIQSSDGVDYFLPDSYVYRVFDFTLLDFGAVDVMVQVVYSELTHTYKDTFPGVVGVGVSSESRSLSKGLRDSVRPSTTTTTTTTTTWTAVVESNPLRLSVSAQLLPYGRGGLSSMQYLYRKNRFSLWYRELDGLHDSPSPSSSSSSGLPFQAKVAHWAREASCPAIPWAVFYCLWQRLAGEHTKTFTSDCRISWTSKTMQRASKQDSVPVWEILVSDYITEAVLDAVNLYGGMGTHMIGMDSRVHVDSNHYSGSSSSSSEQHRAAVFVGWCFQTIFGDELVVKMEVINATTIVDSATGVAVPWAGDGREVEVVLRCRWSLRALREGLLEAIEEDFDEFLYALTAGCCCTQGASSYVAS